MPPPRKSTAADGAAVRLRAVRRWYFNPLVRSEAEAAMWLCRNGSAEGDAIAVDGVVFLMRRVPGSARAAAPAKPDGGGDDDDEEDVVRIDARAVPREHFLSHTDVGAAVDALASRIEAVPELAPFRGWSVNVAAPGTVFRTPLAAPAAAAGAPRVARRQRPRRFDLLFR